MDTKAIQSVLGKQVSDSKDPALILGKLLQAYRCGGDAVKLDLFSALAQDFALREAIANVRNVSQKPSDDFQSFGPMVGGGAAW